MAKVIFLSVGTTTSDATPVQKEMDWVSNFWHCSALNSIWYKSFNEKRKGYWQRRRKVILTGEGGTSVFATHVVVFKKNQTGFCSYIFSAIWTTPFKRVVASHN